MRYQPAEEVKAEDDELVPDNMIGIYLSKEFQLTQWEKLLRSPITRWLEILRSPATQSRREQTKLRQFIHSEANIRCLKYLGSGEDGVVVLAIIKGKEYALKVVSRFNVLLQAFDRLISRSSSKNGSRKVQSTTQKKKRNISLHWLMKAEHLPFWRP